MYTLLDATVRAERGTTVQLALLGRSLVLLVCLSPFYTKSHEVHCLLLPAFQSMHLPLSTVSPHSLLAGAETLCVYCLFSGVSCPLLGLSQGALTGSPALRSACLAPRVSLAAFVQPTMHPISVPRATTAPPARTLLLRLSVPRGPLRLARASRVPISASPVPSARYAATRALQVQTLSVLLVITAPQEIRPTKRLQLSSSVPLETTAPRDLSLLSHVLQVQHIWLSVSALFVSIDPYFP